MKKPAVTPPPPDAENLALALAAARAREEGLRAHPLRAHTSTRERFQRACSRALEVLSADLLNGLSDRIEELLERMHRAGQPTPRK